MIWALIGILVGIIIGFISNYSIPIEYIKYTAVTIVGIIDALLGAIKAEVGDNDYNPLIFITGLVFNIILALGITMLGEQLGLDLYIAATVVFTWRIFTNLAIIRRSVLDKFFIKKKKRK